MSRDCCGAMGLSAVVIVVFPNHTHLLFYIYTYIITIKMPHSYKESFTFLNRDVAFSPRDFHSYIEISYGK